jgi:hypothetical protein
MHLPGGHDTTGSHYGNAMATLAEGFGGMLPEKVSMSGARGQRTAVDPDGLVLRFGFNPKGNA